MEGYKVCISIVSHEQGALIRYLLMDLARLPLKNCEVLITLNVPEDEGFFCHDYPFPLRIIRNPKPNGFGENHNLAFAKSNCDFFIIVNPDIRIQSLNIHDLLTPFMNLKVAALAPVVLSEEGRVEDNARRFPTLLRFTIRFLLRRRCLEYSVSYSPYLVDWVAGMFVVFRSKAYRQVHGFDDRRFFMYLEDADICRRLQENGWEIMVNPSVSVTHAAQRASRRNLKHMRWHLMSAFRYLTGL